MFHTIFENQNFDFFEVKKYILGGFLCPQTCFLQDWHVFHMCIKFGPKIWKFDLFLRDFKKIYPKSEKNTSKLEQFSSQILLRDQIFSDFSWKLCALKIQGKISFSVKLLQIFRENCSNYNKWKNRVSSKWRKIPILSLNSNY